MVTINYVAALSGAPSNYVDGITDLDVHWLGGVAVLYAATGPGGGITAYELSSGSVASYLDRQSYGVGSGWATPTRIEILDMGAQPLIVPVGRPDPALTSYALNPAGDFSSTTSFSGDAAFQGDLLTMATHHAGGRTFLYASEWGDAGIAAYEVTAGQTLSRVSGSSQAGGHQGADIAAMATMQVAGNSLLLAASSFDNMLTSYRIGPDGALAEAGHLGAAEGVGIAAPTALETVDLGAGQYAILASAGSSSLTVFEVHAGGALEMRDHVIDSLGTRFQAVRALEVAMVDDRAFVLAGGGDDGLSLFALLPGGRLLHLATIADSALTTLANVTALSATAINGMIQVFASSESEAGITQFAIDPGPLGMTEEGGAGDDTLQGGAAGDLLSGGDGDDSLAGAAGNDILLDGFGQDTLRGGAGSDVFVFTADDADDTVLDFEAGVDQLDLSGMHMLYDAAQLDFQSTAQGIVIRYGAETFTIVSHDLMPLTAAHFPTAAVLGLSRPPMVSLMSGMLLRGTAGDDSLTGSAGNDTLTGDAGADTLDGGAGTDIADYAGAAGGIGISLQRGKGFGPLANGDILTGIENVAGSDFSDTLNGSTLANDLSGRGGNDIMRGFAGDDTIDGGAGDDVILGGLGDDLLTGGDGDDTLNGQAGEDVIDGGAGNDLIRSSFLSDTVNGGDGNDFIDGGALDDVLRGQNGNDTLQGVTGNDHLSGHAGDDLLLGGAGQDTLAGGGGQDTLRGGNNSDLLHGGAGGDLLQGQDGLDTLDGGIGNDTLVGGNHADTFVFAPGYQLDRINDFASAQDVLQFDDALWGGGLTAQQVVDTFATVVGSNTIFDFGNGDELMISGVVDLQAFVADILLI